MLHVPDGVEFPVETIKVPTVEPFRVPIQQLREYGTVVMLGCLSSADRSSCETLLETQESGNNVMPVFQVVENSSRSPLRVGRHYQLACLTDSSSIDQLPDTSFVEINAHLWFRSLHTLKSVLLRNAIKSVVLHTLLK